MRHLRLCFFFFYYYCCTMLQNPQEAVHTLLFNRVSVTTEGERPDGWRCQSRETLTRTELPALQWKTEEQWRMLWCMLWFNAGLVKSKSWRFVFLIHVFQGWMGIITDHKRRGFCPPLLWAAVWVFMLCLSCHNTKTTTQHETVRSPHSSSVFAPVFECNDSF